MAIEECPGIEPGEPCGPNGLAIRVRTLLIALQAESRGIEPRVVRPPRFSRPLADHSAVLSKLQGVCYPLHQSAHLHKQSGLEPDLPLYKCAGRESNPQADGSKPPRFAISFTCAQVGKVGFEPTASSFQRTPSDLTDLLPEDGAPWIRTKIARLFKPPLYHWS